MKYRVSPSRIGSYFTHTCERYLVYEGLNDSERESIGWEKDRNHNVISENAGIEWEQEVLDKLDARGEKVYKIPDKIDGLSREESDQRLISKTIELLRDVKEGYIYQAVLYLTDSFKSDYISNVDSDFITWNPSKSDLIRIDSDPKTNEKIFSVIDIKHARRAKINHKIQIAVYVDMLKTILKENGIDAVVNDKMGYVWPFKADNPSSFSLGDIQSFLHDFYSRTLPGAVESLKDSCDSSEDEEICERLDEKLKYCFSEKCEWCGNLNHCIKWAEENEPIKLVPQMTIRTQELLSADSDIPKTIDGFLDYLNDKDNSEKICEESGFIKKRIDYMSTVMQAVKNRMDDERNNRYSKAVYSMDMPKWQDVTIILTAQREVGLDRVYLYGVRISLNKKPDKDKIKDNKFIGIEADEKGYFSAEETFIAESEEDFGENTKKFVDYLYSMLEKIDKYNRDIDAEQNTADKWKKYLSVQCYVMDNYEFFNLEEGLFDELLKDGIDDDYRDKILSIIFWLQGEKMITDSEQQGSDISEEFPLVVLSSAIGKLYVIPGYISNNLEDISKAISETFNIDIEKSKKYSNPLSNALKSDVINEIWKLGKEEIEETEETIRKERKEKRKEELEKLSKFIKIRLAIENNIISKIQKGDDKHTGLKRNASNFYLVTSQGRMDQRRAKLYIELKYEQLLTYHDIKRVRMGSLEEAAEDGSILKVEVVSEEVESGLKNFYKKGILQRVPETVPGFKVKYRVLNKDNFFLEEWFAAYALKTDTESIEELAAVNDLKEKSSRYIINNVPRLKHICYFNDMKFYYENGEMYVSGKRLGNVKYQKGTKLYLVDRFIDTAGDYSIDKIQSGIRNINILYPENLYTVIYENGSALDYEASQNILKKYSKCDGFDFSTSQEKAMKQLFEKNITLLLGPPGSGKTDFIARAIITLCGYYKEIHNKNLSILVTANSHAAINNILEKLIEKEQEVVQNNELEKSTLPQVIKADKYDGQEVRRNVNGVIVYDKWYDYGIIDEATGRRGYITDGSVDPKLPIFLRAVQKGRTDWISGYEYDIERPFVVGATSSTGMYVSHKLDDGDYEGFDIVIIDEASQVRTADAMINMDWTHSNTRFLIVGDENQLSPIIKGKYEAPDGSVDMYGSIFKTYSDTAAKMGLDYKFQLEENFRMNEVLDRYSGLKIYDVDIQEGDGRNGYHAANDKIGKQKLSLAISADEMDAELIKEENDELTNMALNALDPDYPLVLIKLSGSKAMSKQELEIALATKITELAKKYIVDGSGNGYATEAEFWGDSDNKGAFAIISPHHEHINKLKDNISLNLGMDRNKLYIGTVDKLQGQEREAVVVSYGVSNIERALSEIEFIYSRNRLNVSITRGKKKTIVILTDALLDKPIELLDQDDENIQNGISFMCDFEKFMRGDEEDTMLDDSFERSVGDVKVEIMKKKIKED